MKRKGKLAKAPPLSSIPDKCEVVKCKKPTTKMHYLNNGGRAYRCSIHNEKDK